MDSLTSINSNTGSNGFTAFESFSSCGVEFLDVKNLSICCLCCQVDHMLVVGEEDHLGLGPQVCQDFQGCPGAFVVEVDEGIVYEKGKRLAVGAEFLQGRQAKG